MVINAKFTILRQNIVTYVVLSLEGYHIFSLKKNPQEEKIKTLYIDTVYIK